MPTNSPHNSAISSKFDELRSRGEGALITYLTGGDPNPSEFANNVTALVEGGADMVEIGIPFSDPIADGHVIQASSQRALRGGATPKTILSQVKELSTTCDLPFVILTYYNPILAVGAEAFCRSAKDSGVDGLVVADLPEGEDPSFHRLVLKSGLDHIPLVAPNTQGSRLEAIVENATGFIYLVSLYGVTGVRDSLGSSVADSLKRVRSLNPTKVPVCVGFGVSEPDHVKNIVHEGADGVIVGSALVKIVGDQTGGSDQVHESLRRTVAQLKAATRKSVEAIEA